MVRASQALQARLRFSTKNVGKGFYRGNRTGSMGAHTEYGGYVIDWRKVRNYNVPEGINGKQFRLTPFVTKQIHTKERPEEVATIDFALPSEDSGVTRTELYQRAMPSLIRWRQQNPEEFREWVQAQYDQKRAQELELPGSQLRPNQAEATRDILEDTTTSHKSESSNQPER